LLLLSFLDVLPFHFRELFDDLLQFLVISHGLPYPLFPAAGNIKLTDLAAPALHEIQRNVRLPMSATTPGLAALAAAHRKGSPKNMPEMNQLGSPGTEAAFLRFHRDSTHGNFSSGITMLYQIRIHVNAKY